MADPTTGNKLLATPSHGSDVNTWDQPLNGNSSGLDGMLGGALTLALAATSTVLLTVPATGSVSAGAGPNQSQNALIKFTGALTGNQIIQFTLPGFYIVQNLCSNNASFFIALKPASGGGNQVCAPPGQKVHVFFDGTDMDYVDTPSVGSFMDLACSAYPNWMSNCSVVPWLACDGLVYNQTSYTALCALLGSTFGGNGITTFGVPDLRARYRIPLDNQGLNGTAGRITAAISNINGTTWGASGGDQRYQQHNHAITDPGHVHAPDSGSFIASGGSPGITAGANAHFGALTANATTNITINNAGTGSSGNIPPGLVTGMSFIKT